MSLFFAACARADVGLAGGPDISVSVTAGGSELKITDGSGGPILSVCRLAVQVPLARLSFDKSAVIVSDTSYLAMSDIRNCNGRRLVPKEIDTSVGTLVDVNGSAKLYLTLDVISTAPLAYLATVARFGSRRNLVSLPGAYVEGKTLSELQEHGFSYDPDEPPRIAPSGRYVSPSGAPDCSPYAFPGVWDLENGVRVSFSGQATTIQERCDALFR